MSVAQIRGGIPNPYSATVDTTGHYHPLPFYSFYLVARNLGDNVIRLYFKEVDFTNDENYVTLQVASTSTPHGEWKGPVEAKECWVKSQIDDSTVEIVSFQRRG